MDDKPVCPHCSKEINADELKTTLTGFGPSWINIYMISCHHPECRKVLGITKIEDATVSGLQYEEGD